MVAYLKLNHEFQVFNTSDAASAAIKVISILKTFDPMQVRHGIPVYIGLTKACEKGLKSILMVMDWMNCLDTHGSSIFPKTTF